MVCFAGQDRTITDSQPQDSKAIYNPRSIVVTSGLLLLGAKEVENVEAIGAEGVHEVIIKSQPITSLSHWSDFVFQRQHGLEAVLVGPTLHHNTFLGILLRIQYSMGHYRNAMTLAL